MPLDLSFEATFPDGGGSSYGVANYGWAASGNGAPAWRLAVENLRSMNNAPFATDTSSPVWDGSGATLNVNSYRYTHTPGDTNTGHCYATANGTTLNMSNFDFIGPDGNQGGGPINAPGTVIAASTGGYLRNLSNGRILGFNSDLLLHQGHPSGLSTIENLYLGQAKLYPGSDPHYNHVTIPNMIYGDMLFRHCYFDHRQPSGDGTGMDAIVKCRPDGTDGATTKSVNFEESIFDCNNPLWNSYLLDVRRGTNFRPTVTFTRCLLPLSQMMNSALLAYADSVFAMVDCYDLYTGAPITWSNNP